MYYQSIFFNIYCFLIIHTFFHIYVIYDKNFRCCFYYHIRSCHKFIILPLKDNDKILLLESILVAQLNISYPTWATLLEITSFRLGIYVKTAINFLLLKKINCCWKPGFFGIKYSLPKNKYLCYLYKVRYDISINYIILVDNCVILITPALKNSHTVCKTNVKKLMNIVCTEVQSFS